MSEGVMVFAVVVLLFFAVLGFNYALTLAVLRTPLADMFRDRPDHRKVHQTSTPRSGGVCIAITVVTALLVVRYALPAGIVTPLPSSLWDPLMFSLAAIMVVGALDDITAVHITNTGKFLLEVVVAFCVVFVFHVRLNVLYLNGQEIHLGLAGDILSALWIVGVANAFNLIDGVDTLAGSVAVIAACAFGVLALESGSTGVAVLCVILAGTVSGFLLHNRPPAAVFMGDTGALLLGLVFGILSLYVMMVPGVHYTPIVVPLLVGLPVLDVGVAMARRFIRALLNGRGVVKALKAVGEPDSEHMHHRLVHRGLTHSQAVVVLSMVAATLCASALIVTRVPDAMAITLLLYLAAITFVWLDRLNFFDRLYRMFARPRLDQTPPVSFHLSIAVAGADEVLMHALRTYPQDMFAFRFADTTASLVEMPASVYLIVNRDVHDFARDWSDADMLSRQKRVPVVVVADEKTAEVELVERSIQNGVDLVSLTHKPVYIPLLMKQLDSSSRHARATQSFSVVLTNLQSAATEWVKR